MIDAIKKLRKNEEIGINYLQLWNLKEILNLFSSNTVMTSVKWVNRMRMWNSIERILFSIDKVISIVRNFHIDLPDEC